MSKKKQASPKELAGVMPSQGRGRIHSDVLGSYTGAPEDDEYAVPEQDADDL